MRAALLADGWSEVASSGDVVLDGEQYYVGMAVDMAIAERAQVFVGNGVRRRTCALRVWLADMFLVFESVVQRGDAPVSQGNGPVDQSFLVDPLKTLFFFGGT